MEKLDSFLRSSYYTQLISLTIAIVALIISLAKKDYKKSLTLFRLYFLGYIILCAINFIAAILPLEKFKSLIIQVPKYADLSFTFFEFFLFLTFIKNEVKRHRILFNVMSYLFYAFATILILKGFLSSKELSIESIQDVFVLQSIILLTCCFLYFRELFNLVPDFSLSTKSSFWIITGLSFTMLCTLPFSIFSNYLLDYNFDSFINLYSIFYIFYSLLFIMIIRAHYAAQ